MVQYQGYTKSSIPTLCFHIENPAVVPIQGKSLPFNYYIYQDIRAFHQYHCLQSSGWTAHLRVIGHISTAFIAYLVATNYALNTADFAVF